MFKADGNKAYQRAARVQPAGSYTGLERGHCKASSVRYDLKPKVTKD